jgi:hypothetical protein
MYRLRELWEAAPGENSRTAAHTYRGPSLTLLGGPEGRAWPELLVLNAPGILEVSTWGNDASTSACFTLSNLYRHLKYKGACLSVALWHSARSVTFAVLWHGRAGRCCCRGTRCTSAATRTQMSSLAPGCWRRTARPACWCRRVPSGSALTHSAGWGERDKEAQHCSVMSRQSHLTPAARDKLCHRCLDVMACKPLTSFATMPTRLELCCRARPWPRDVLFHIRFGFDRTPFRRMHAALWAAMQEPVLRMLAPPLTDAGSTASSVVRKRRCPMQALDRLQRPASA